MKNKFNQLPWYSKLIVVIILVAIVFAVISLVKGKDQKVVENPVPSQNQTASSTPMAKSGIKGVSTIGPTCSPDKVASEANCADKLFPVKLEIFDVSGSLVLATTTSSKGLFSADFAPGTYTIKSGIEATSAKLEPMVVTVYPGQYADVVVMFDKVVR